MWAVDGDVVHCRCVDGMLRQVSRAPCVLTRCIYAILVVRGLSKPPGFATPVADAALRRLQCLAGFFLFGDVVVVVYHTMFEYTTRSMTFERYVYVSFVLS